MPPAISRKEEHFQSYRSGYHEVAPSLDGVCEKAHFGIGEETCNLACHKSIECDQRMSQYKRNELEIVLIPLRRFVDASRDKPERRALSVLTLRLPRSRAFAGWSI
ncbi:MAG TPA: hypothetical protein K8V56_14555 [Sporosarcina psychrophila]|uniref:Uncharacterized protein n=1 Tax=Sporosarcina psychrophila TaxID=1476 RepID=A0A921KDS2_SPOPS|nr:hypothetical protein [Sporosarcina psychrophila]